MNPPMHYAKTQKAKDFLNSEAGRNAYEQLVKMVEDDTFNTSSTFSPSAEDGRLQFIDKHMTYLCTHLHVNSVQYLSNLNLLTKIRK